MSADTLAFWIILAVNTLGVLYLVGAGEEITSITDLAGKTIYASKTPIS